MPWVDPGLSLRWGPYSKPDPDEQTALVTLVQTALGAAATGGEQLITKRMAVEKVGPMFGIEDIDAALDALEKEAAENDAKALQKAVDTQKAMGAVAPPKPGDSAQKTPPPAKGPPKP